MSELRWRALLAVGMMYRLPRGWWSMYSRSSARFMTILKMALACLAVPNVMPDSHSCTSLALMSSSAVSPNVCYMLCLKYLT